MIPLFCCFKPQLQQFHIIFKHFFLEIFKAVLPVIYHNFTGTKDIICEALRAYALSIKTDTGFLSAESCTKHFLVLNPFTILQMWRLVQGKIHIKLPKSLIKCTG
jgi:hypothetical protein